MERLTELLQLCRRLDNLAKPSRRVDIKVAALLGWSQCGCRDSRTWTGYQPGRRGLRIVPRFTGSQDDALLFKPEDWVESYFHRFDNTFRAECHPRGDLGLQTWHAEHTYASIAMLKVFTLAHLDAMEHSRDC